MSGNNEDIEYDYGDDIIETSNGKGDKAESSGRRADDGRRRSRSPGRHHRVATASSSTPYAAPSNTSPHHRYFVLKCEYYSIFSQAKRTNMWPARPHIAERLVSALAPASSTPKPRITLFFTLEKARCFVAMATLDPQFPPRETGRFVEIGVKWEMVKDVQFNGLGLPVGVFADPAMATVRDGIEFGYSDGKAIEMAFVNEGEDGKRAFRAGDGERSSRAGDGERSSRADGYPRDREPARARDPARDNRDAWVDNRSANRDYRDTRMRR